MVGTAAVFVFSCDDHPVYYYVTSYYTLADIEPYLPSLLERSARVIHLDLFVCLSVWARHSKTVAPIGLICLHTK